MIKKSNLLLTLFFIFINEQYFSQCTEAKDSEMAKYMQLTKERDAQGCSQCGMLAMYFCSAKYTVTEADKQKVSAMIEACKGNIRQMGQPFCCPDYLAKQPEWGIMAANQSSNALSNRSPESSQGSQSAQFQSTINQIDQGIQSIQAIQNVKSIEKSINENSTLSTNYHSASELEADYNKKLSRINNSIEQLAVAENVQLQVAFNGVQSQLTPELQAIGGIAVDALSILNSAQVEKEKIRAEQYLAEQKRKALLAMEQERHLAKVELRRTIFLQYNEKSIPLTSDRNKNEALYFFAYDAAANLINAYNPILSVSNVFMVRKYSDDTWPFQKNILAELVALGFVDPVITGGYIDISTAEREYTNFIRLLKLTTITAKEKNYDGKNAKNTQIKNQDFWGAPVQVKEVVNKDEKKSPSPDFWGEPIKQP